MDFFEELKKYQSLVNSELEKYLKKEDCFEKILNDSMEYSLMAGGKRLRAILVIDVYRLFKDDYEECLPFSMAIEMIHNFSLIHDDLPEVDNDDFRHGKPTNHKQFNHATALLAGDSLMNYAYVNVSKELLNSMNNNDSEKLKREVRALHELSVGVDRMIAGEYLDTEMENKEVSLELLKYIHTNKTGALLAVSARMGAILAGASEEEIDNISKYAEKIGLAFQIKDDILSVEGNEKITGKPVGNDEEHHKCTYVSYYGLEKAKQELDNTIEEALGYLDVYGERANFLRELTLYIKTRNK